MIGEQEESGSTLVFSGSSHHVSLTYSLAHSLYMSLNFFQTHVYIFPTETCYCYNFVFNIAQRVDNFPLGATL